MPTFNAKERIGAPISEATGTAKPVASPWHLAGYLLFMAYLTYAGFRAQSTSTASAGQLVDHSGAMRSYWISILANVGITYYCWAGVHWRGGTLRTLTGGRWTSLRGVLVDVAIAIPFSLLWLGVADAVQWMLGPDHGRSVSSLLPQSVAEILLWILVCVVAGFCEEIQSRGYLQQQLHGFSGSIVVAVLGQAVIFGLIHSYQGWKLVLVIAVLGVLYGALAAWRRNLRANMISHAGLDIWAGWLSAVLKRQGAN